MPKIIRIANTPTVASKILDMKRFKGVDLTSGVTSMDISRSPDCINMMPDLEGFPVKRFGYKIEKTYPDKINAAHCLVVEGQTKTLIHSGDCLYLDDKVIYTGIQNTTSNSAVLENRLYILDGNQLLVFGRFDDNWCVKTAESIATVPTITIGRKPSGGGTSYNPPNLLTGWVEEHFVTDATSKAYQLSYTNLCDDAPVSVLKMDIDAQWKSVTAFTVDYIAGVITFDTSIGTPPITGHDNLKIKYKKLNDGAVINKATTMAVFGVNGQPDRLWVAANENAKNRASFSQFRDPLYFGDIWYTLIGGANNPVMGFSLVEDSLVIHKKGEAHDLNAYVLSGKIDVDGAAVFPIKNVLQGEGATAKNAFATFATEPVFLTNRGVFALAQQDTVNQRYTQNRSYYINGKLLNEANLQNAIACVFGRFYLLFLNKKVYVLDSEQKNYEKNSPYSTYQYECFVWNNIAATAVWVAKNTLWFGDKNGVVHRFLPNYFFDIGNPINAYWSTPLLNLGSFSRYKTVSGVWVVCQPYTRSGASVFYASDKEYQRLAAQFNIDILDFDDIDFNRFTFNTLDRPCIEFAKKKAKKVKLFQVKIQNDKAEPFGMAALQLEYKIGGKIK